MPVSSFFIQPAATELRAAYQSTYLMISGTKMPVVYFDIYFNNGYYKTITTTTPYAILGTNAALYRVDIKDAIQEYLRTTPPVQMRITSNPYYQETPSTATCFVRVRGSITATVYNNGVPGFLVLPETPAPVQATFTTAATAGAGTQSNTFVVVNATLQHEQQQDLRLYLRGITDSFADTRQPVNYVLNLSPRKDLQLTMQDYGWWPVIFDRSTGYGPVTIWVIADNGAQYNATIGNSFFIRSYAAFYLPIGVLNLQALPSGAAIPFYSMNWYTVALLPANPLLDGSYSTPKIYIKKCKSEKRIYFMNWLAHFEAVSFHDYDETNNTTSSTWQKPLTSEPLMGNKSIGGDQRFNVRSNEEVTVYATMQEKDMQLIKELQTAPAAYLEFKDANQNPNAGTVIPADLIPIRILDINVITRKVEDRYQYDVALKYSPSNPNIHPRN